MFYLNNTSECSRSDEIISYDDPGSQIAMFICRHPLPVGNIRPLYIHPTVSQQGQKEIAACAES